MQNQQSMTLREPNCTFTTIRKCTCNIDRVNKNTVNSPLESISLAPYNDANAIQLTEALLSEQIKFTIEEADYVKIDNLSLESGATLSSSSLNAKTATFNNGGLNIEEDLEVADTLEFAGECKLDVEGTIDCRKIEMEPNSRVQFNGTQYGSASELKNAINIHNITQGKLDVEGDLKVAGALKFKGNRCELNVEGTITYDQLKMDQGCKVEFNGKIYSKLDSLRSAIKEHNKEFISSQPKRTLSYRLTSGEKRFMGHTIDGPQNHTNTNTGARFKNLTLEGYTASKPKRPELEKNNHKWRDNEKTQRESKKNKANKGVYYF